MTELFFSYKEKRGDVYKTNEIKKSLGKFLYLTNYPKKKEKMILINNWENILIAFLIVIAVILIILEILEKKLYKKILTKREGRNKFYLQKIKNLKRTNNELALNKINNLTIKFFKEVFGIKGIVEFSKLKIFFEQKNKLEESKFCEILEKKLFSGKEVNEKDIENLILKLKEIIEKNHILTKEEKENLKEKKLKEKKKKRLLKKLNIPGMGNKKVKNKQKNRKKNQVISKTYCYFLLS